MLLSIRSLAGPAAADGPTVSLFVETATRSGYRWPVAFCGLGGLAVRATSCSPRCRIPRTIAGRAVRVGLRLPPPSWRITIEPGRTAERTRFVIALGELPGRQSAGPTDQSTTRWPSA